MADRSGIGDSHHLGHELRQLSDGKTGPALLLTTAQTPRGLVSPRLLYG